MAKITTAIEIKKDVLRVAQLKKGFKEISLLGYLEEKLPFPASLEIEENIGLVSSKLKSLLPRLPERVRNPVFIIPTSEIMVRFFDLPYLGKVERKEAIKYEAQKYIPFAIDEIISDFYVPYEMKGKEMRVIYTAIKNDVLTRYLNIITALGVRPSAIEPYPFSLLRALFTSGDLKPKEFVIIVDLDYSGSTIIVTQGINLFIARDFVIPAFSETASEDMIGKVVFEINRTIDYMIKEFPHQPIKEIILSGEISNQEIRNNLMDKLNLTVKLASLEGKLTAENGELLRKYLGLLGAGLRSLVSYDVDLEFFSDYQRKIMPEKAIKLSDFVPRELVQDLLLIILGILGANFYLQHQVRFVKNMQEAVSLPRGVSINDESKIRAEIKNLQEKVQTYQNLLEKRFQPTNIFNFIPQKLPPGIWLETLELTRAKNGQLKMLLSGYGYDSEGKGVNLAYDLLEKINISPEAKWLFSDVKITSLEKVELEGFKVIKFKLGMVLK